MIDKNKNGIDDEIEKRLLRDAILIQISGIIIFIILAVIISFIK